MSISICALFFMARSAPSTQAHTKAKAEPDRRPRSPACRACGLRHQRIRKKTCQRKNAMARRSSNLDKPVAYHGVGAPLAAENGVNLLAQIGVSQLCHRREAVDATNGLISTSSLILTPFSVISFSKFYERIDGGFRARITSLQGFLANDGLQIRPAICQTRSSIPPGRSSVGYGQSW